MTNESEEDDRVACTRASSGETSAKIALSLTALSAATSAPSARSPSCVAPCTIVGAAAAFPLEYSSVNCAATFGAGVSGAAAARTNESRQNSSGLAGLTAIYSTASCMAVVSFSTGHAFGYRAGLVHTFIWPWICCKESVKGYHPQSSSMPIVA